MGKFCFVCGILFCASSLNLAFAGVTVTAPTNGATVAPSVQYVANATSPGCSKGVASIGIYTAPGNLAYVAKGSSLNTILTLSPGTYKTTVQEWDNCGWSSSQQVTITVGSGGSSRGGTFWNLQGNTAGWTGYGLLPPVYAICSTFTPAGPNAPCSWIPGATAASSSLQTAKTTNRRPAAATDVF